MARTIVTGGFWHESNTFNPMLASIDSFVWHEGDEIMNWVRETSPDSELRGMIEELTPHGDAILPLVALGAPVAGSVPASVFELYIERLKKALQRLDAMAVDGVIWGLHGSASVEGVDDAQAYILEILRSALGEDIPLIVSVDLHASISPRLQRLVDGIAGYLTAPHRDMVETGRRAAKLLVHRLSGDQTGMGMAMVTLPLLLPGEFGQTETSPTKDIMQLLREFCQREDVLDAGFLQGFPWADNPHATASLVAVTAGVSGAETLSQLQQIARRVWAERARFYRSAPVLSIAEAMDVARRRERGNLLYFCDSGDNPTAGAVEDRVDLLAAVLQAGLRDFLFAPIVAPQSVAVCQGNAGRTLELSIGSQLMPGESSDITVQANVLWLHEDSDAGSTAMVEVEGNRLLLTSRRIAMRSPEWIEGLGLDPRDPKWLWVVKSGYLFPAYQDMISSIKGAEAWLVTTAGASSLDMNTFTYANLPQVPYPLTAHADHEYSMVTRLSAARQITYSVEVLSDGTP